MENITPYHIDFEPLGKRGKCTGKKSLLDCARQLGMGINSICGGKGKCHSCKVQIISGTTSKPTSNELEAFSSQEMSDGWSLACQTHPTSDCKLIVPPESMTTTQRVQVEGLEISVHPEPVVQQYDVVIPSPSLSDLQADADRLLGALNQQHQARCGKVDVQVLRELSPQLRSWDWRCQASVRGDEVVAVGAWASNSLGLAIDLGTTKVAGYLIDLGTGKTLASKGIMNPQISYGEDIISRIMHVIETPAEAERLQGLAIEAVGQLAKELCAEVDVRTAEIVDVVVVGNTAMHHLLVRLPVGQLAYSPFVPAITKALDIKARDLGFNIAPGAYVHLLPNIAGFVGGDHVAMLLATDCGRAEGLVLALDIGTNTEVSLIENGNISTVSCASGPAFEGGHIKDGMRAASGAIERLRIADNGIQYQTINEAPPVGICGSGIIDTMSQLYLAGVLDRSGKMKRGHPRVRRRQNQREFVVVSEEERGGSPAITVSQQDVRELQLAKAAIRTGIQILLEHTDHGEEEIGQVIVAGAFGTYIDVASAVTIGMLPSLPLHRFHQVGNAAGMGAKLALVSLQKRAEAQSLASRVHYIELASTPNFAQTFAQASFIGKYRIADWRKEDVD